MNHMQCPDCCGDGYIMSYHAGGPVPCRPCSGLGFLRTVVLDEWRIGSWRAGYKAPELNAVAVRGRLRKDHPIRKRWKAGLFIRTGPIRRVIGLSVFRTYNNVYELGAVNRDYMKWMLKSGLDPGSPFRELSLN